MCSCCHYVLVYGVIAFTAIHQRELARFYFSTGSLQGLYDVRSRCRTTQQAADEIIRRRNELKEEVECISRCCVKAFLHSIVYVGGISECSYILTLRGIFT